MHLAFAVRTFASLNNEVDPSNSIGILCVVWFSKVIYFMLAVCSYLTSVRAALDVLNLLSERVAVPLYVITSIFLNKFTLYLKWYVSLERRTELSNSET